MENTPVSCANRVALFTIAVGRDPVYFDSVRRYFPYNKENFGQGQAVDYYLFTDRSETIEGIINIPCSSVRWRALYKAPYLRRCLPKSVDPTNTLLVKTYYI